MDKAAEKLYCQRERGGNKMNLKEFKWTRMPKSYKICDDKIEIVTKPHTDLWQRTYYHFRNDNAPVLQMYTDEKFFFICSKNRIF